MLLQLDQAKEINGSEEVTKLKSDPVALYTQLHKDMGISLSQHLENLDPTELDENGKPITSIDAFTRHLIVNDIQLHGPQQWTVSRLMNDASYLMPELILREFRAGMMVQEKFSYADCISARIPTKQSTYHPLYTPNQNLSTAQSRRAHGMGGRAAAELGGGFPRLSIRKRSKDITVDDNGRIIEAAYGVVRDYGFEDFAINVRLCGAQYAAEKLFEVYDMGVSGDGTVGAATDTFNGTAGSLAYSDLVRNSTMFDAPFVMDRILAPQQSIENILTMAQFTDPLSGWKFQKDGTLVTPMGAKLKQVNNVTGGTATGTVIVTLAKEYAVKEIVLQDLQVEAEKIIARKFEEAVISEESAFCVIADGALKRIVWT